ncbi:hypothetical protein [Aestuariicoccus sp. MJ-SS9]|uniref:hypothetical protein n=1 Tax=Aestuariicoccus sp. MJ-SS9 TaxID=3079855 RepID=UPI0029144A6E|nr:hypothetical protein [Aestuariicoccus sp. MJ-SS9]MDU8913453.1 hypothetical protein [Aestuariicoccus sp. MJ-SS9]
MTDRIVSLLLIGLTGLFGLSEWGVPLPPFLLPGIAGAVVLLLSLQVRMTRKAFVLTGGALTLALGLAGQDWVGPSLLGLEKAAFIGAFFVALSTLRNVAETSPALRRAGTFLAAQPPGRRYAALTVGGHLFALLINYGAISLLGGLATQSARADADPLIRRIRTRRMLLAIQRGFIASLTWSPLAFAIAITTALIPGARWADVFLPGLVTAAIISATGWAMDTIFKPRLANPPPRRAVDGSWALMMPLVLLLVLLGTTVLGLHVVFDVRVVGVVMLVVPAIAMIWALVQHAGQDQTQTFGARLRGYVDAELPNYRGELVLLMMAGYIGTVGAPLLQPIIASLGLDPALLPPWVVLASMIWLIPLLGQFGMNPILAVTLMAPLIPDPDVLGVSPAALVSAICAGWALSGATSPFTATTLLIGSFGNVSALHVGLRWNGGYFLVAAGCLTLWILVYGFVIG